MDDQPCASCGATRKPGMDFCWQCYTPYTRAPQPVGVAAGPLGTGGSPAPEAVSAGPLARPGGSMVSDALRGQTATGTTTAASPTPERASWIGPALKVVVFLVFAVGGFLAWRFLTAGFPFPEVVAGQPRMEGEQAERLSRLVEDIGALANAEIDVALYGQGPLPAYTVYVAEFESPDVIDLGELSDPAYTASLKTGQIACRAEAQGTSCAWLDGETTIVGVGGFGLATEELLPVAREVRSGLD
jgi:hypothetical protein